MSTTLMSVKMVREICLAKERKKKNCEHLVCGCFIVIVICYSPFTGGGLARQSRHDPKIHPTMHLHPRYPGQRPSTLTLRLFLLAAQISSECGSGKPRQ
ncbi:hypothetical protein BDR05DRAFT_967412 [Suillus weaverae]|nr:hypothetical protein BDR05DRAFT_967412 [Suillus weaverae]